MTEEKLNHIVTFCGGMFLCAIHELPNGAKRDQSFYQCLKAMKEIYKLSDDQIKRIADGY